jgi:hypothetical protein
MALVDYSDSDSEEAQAEASSPTKKRRVSKGDSNDLPPLPASFLDQYSSTVRTSTGDDPSLHGGRKRVTPHIEGNWPTHVYLECKCTTLRHRPFPLPFPPCAECRCYYHAAYPDETNVDEGTQPQRNMSYYRRWLRPIDLQSAPNRSN